MSEAERRALHDGLVKKLGVDLANTLMEHLPPAGWSDIARRSDLKQMEARIDLKLDALESRLDAKISNKITSQTRWFVGTVVGSVIVLATATISSFAAYAH